MSLILMDDYRPCLVVCGKGITYVTPVVVFERLISGDLKPEDVDEFDKLLPIIIREWLDGCRIK